VPEHENPTDDTKSEEESGWPVKIWQNVQPNYTQHKFTFYSYQRYGSSMHF
jgi:hypothetical protein